MSEITIGPARSTDDGAAGEPAQQPECRYAWSAAGCAHVCHQPHRHAPAHICDYCGLIASAEAATSG